MESEIPSHAGHDQIWIMKGPSIGGKELEQLALLERS